MDLDLVYEFLFYFNNLNVKIKIVKARVYIICFLTSLKNVRQTVGKELS